jgi:serine-type D-Ala-D-Ala carboxypeptidase/endopeptidase
MRIGLAWMTTDKGIVWHNGGTGGYRSFAGFTTDRRRGVIVLANTAIDVDDLGLAVLAADAPLAPAHKEITLPAASLEDYEGTYKLADNFMLKVFRMNDGLFAQATGQGPIPLYPFAPNAFFAKIAGISITFTRDSNGEVIGLVLHQNGDHAAPKLAPSGPKAITLDSATLGDYAGKYKFDFGAVFDVTLKGDHLDAQLTGQPALPIFASARDRFFSRIVDAQFTFERDTDGKVVAVILHQNGRNMRAPRVGAER